MWNRFFRTTFPLQLIWEHKPVTTTGGSTAALLRSNCKQATHFEISTVSRFFSRLDSLLSAKSGCTCRRTRHQPAKVIHLLTISLFLFVSDECYQIEFNSPFGEGWWLNEDYVSSIQFFRFSKLPISGQVELANVYGLWKTPEGNWERKPV